MPIKDGFQAIQAIRGSEAFNPSYNPWSCPIFAVSASLEAVQREYMESLDVDGWILKLIDFKRINVTKGITNPEQQAPGSMRCWLQLGIW